MTPYNLRAKAFQAVILAHLLVVGYTVWGVVILTGMRADRTQPAKEA